MPRLPRSAQMQTATCSPEALPSEHLASPPIGPGSTVLKSLVARSGVTAAVASASSFFGSARTPDTATIMTRSFFSGLP